MYSYEDRIRAVQLYVSLGKSLAATIRQLGYPTPNALKSWHPEWERSSDLAAGYVRLRGKYSAVPRRQSACAPPCIRTRPLPANTTAPPQPHVKHSTRHKPHARADI